MDGAEPRNIEISSSLPVPYVTQYTDRTPTLGPLLLTVIKAWAVLMIEWGSLRWIDHAPASVWIASAAVALLVLGVIEKRDWLHFKNRRYFPTSLAVLMGIWASIVGFAYYLEISSDYPVNPATPNLQAQLASARRERDIAIIERDAANRDRKTTGTGPHNQRASSLQSLRLDNLEARIDVWKSIEGQMNDFNRTLGEGDALVARWKTDQTGLSEAVMGFRQRLNITRGRLAQLIGTYSDFSDLKVIDQAVPAKLSSAVENLLQASTQLPQNTQPSDYETVIGPYIGPFRRELGTTTQWVQSIKNVAASSVSELEGRQVPN
jgi:hypothetical protein